MLTHVQEPEKTWHLPNPPAVPDRLEADGSSQREELEDVEIELTAWMYKIAAETGGINPAAVEGWPSADRDLQRLLAMQGCMS
jgi:ubiquitin carboxyl-terminal hydrolase 25